MTNRKGVTRKLGLAVLALAFMAITRDASAIERKGLVVGLGGGGGTMTCDGCNSTSGFAGQFHLGGMLTDKLALVVDGSGVSREEDGATLTSLVSGVAVQYFVSPRVWVKGGVGAGWLQASIDRISVTSDPGLAFLGGLGVEVLQKEKFAIDLQFRFTTASIEGERNNSFFGVVGFNFY
jgi:Outer membrane protein beta-barrel domain